MGDPVSEDIWRSEIDNRFALGKAVAALLNGAAAGHKIERTAMLDMFLIDGVYVLTTDGHGLLKALSHPEGERGS